MIKPLRILRKLYERAGLVESVCAIPGCTDRGVLIAVLQNGERVPLCPKHSAAWAEMLR